MDHRVREEVMEGFFFAALEGLRACGVWGFKSWGLWGFGCLEVYD